MDNISITRTSNQIDELEKQVQGMDAIDEIPNSITREAIQEIPEMRARPEKYKRYSNFRDVLKETLETEDGKIL